MGGFLSSTHTLRPGVLNRFLVVTHTWNIQLILRRNITNNYKEKGKVIPVFVKHYA
jgi:hypothetical protein